MSPPARALAAAAAGLALTAAWLRWGPPLAASLAGEGAGAGVEAVFTLALFGPLLALALAGGAATGVPAWRSGERPSRAAARGGALGAAGLLLAVAYTALAGTLLRETGATVSAALLLGLLTVALQVAAEELLFRGWLQPLLARALGLSAAVVATALAFAALHLLGGAAGALPLANLALGGLLFGLIAARDGGVAGAVAAHGAWNAGEQLLLGLDPNPGVGAFGALLDLDLAGAAGWGGSDSGLNGSWAMLFALVALSVPLALARREGPGPAAAPGRVVA